MKEIEVIEEALNIATQRGVFSLGDASQVAQCLGIVKAKLSAMDSEPAAKVEGKPQKVNTK